MMMVVVVATCLAEVGLSYLGRKAHHLAQLIQNYL